MDRTLLCLSFLVALLALPSLTFAQSGSVDMSITVNNTIIQDLNDLPIEGKGNTTVWEVIVQTEKSMPSSFNFTFEIYSGAHFITGINGIQQNTVTNLYWFLYINGKESQVGVDQTTLNDNDAIDWKYEKYSGKTLSLSSR